MNNKEKYLPLGTVVMLNKGVHRVMVVGYCAKTEDNSKIYDYIGCMYPEGVFTLEHTLLFNHDDIKKIFFVGLIDDEFKSFEEKLKKFVSKERE